jgi:hypothetical protein
MVDAAPVKPDTLSRHHVDHEPIEAARLADQRMEREHQVWTAAMSRAVQRFTEAAEDDEAEMVQALKARHALLAEQLVDSARQIPAGVASEQIEKAPPAVQRAWLQLTSAWTERLVLRRIRARYRVAPSNVAPHPRARLLSLVRTKLVADSPSLQALDDESVAFAIAVCSRVDSDDLWLPFGSEANVLTAQLWPMRAGYGVVEGNYIPLPSFG